MITVRTTGGELVGLAPLHRRSFPAAGVLRSLGHGAGAVTPFLVAPVKADVAGVIATALVADGRTAHLADLPVDDPTLRAARRDDRLDVDARLHDECPVIRLTGLDDSRSLLAAPSHARLRKLLARADRELAGHDWSVDVATERSAVVQAFRQVGPLYDAAETDRPRLHFGVGLHGDFFTEALGLLADRDQVAFLTLLIDGEAAAFDVHVRINATAAAAILGRFHPTHASISPGHLLLRSGVDWAIDAGLDRLDLQLGDDAYKTSWANDGYDTVEAILAPPGRALVARASMQGIEFAHRFRQRARRGSRPPSELLRRFDPH